jgi:protein phosphatase
MMNAWALTNQGKVRKTNQDSYFYQIGEEVTVGLVCDGMGGAAAGDLASRLAANTFVESLGRPAPDVDTLLAGALAAANQAVYEYSEEHPECEGMGTTLVAALVEGSTAHVINIGDSRCYYLDESGISQVTEDHSVVADLARQGLITPEEARVHPKKNLITRALGTRVAQQGDLFTVPLQPGGMLLLCSDGLSNQVTDQEMLFEALYGGPVEECCGRLVDIALRRGAPDNVTVVLLQANDMGY